MLLRFLPPGSRFRVVSLGIIAELIRVNECRAHVRVDGQATKHVVIDSPDGTRREFDAAVSRETDWTPNLEVEILDFAG